MFKYFTGSIYIERVYHLISSEHESQETKRKCAIDAVNYLMDIGFTKSPYWPKLLLFSGLKDVKESENSAEGEALAIQKTIAHKYTDAVDILESLKPTPLQHYQYLEKIVQCLVLAHNYKGLEELDYRLNIIPASYGNIAPGELHALRRLRLVLCSSFFLKGCYFSCCKSFFKLLNNDPDLLRPLLVEEECQFMTNDEVILMITISTVLAIPFDNYDDFLYVQGLEKIGGVFLKLIEYLKLLINTRFGQLLDIWHGELDDKCKKSVFLNQSWPSAKHMMRSKIYFFYLRISNKVQISYLSHTLHIDSEQLRNEIELLIKSSNLNLEVSGDLISYKAKHYLHDVAPQLTENKNLLSIKLEERRNKNQNLKDLVQEMIVKNNEQRISKSSNSIDSSVRYSFKSCGSADDMDMDELNDISDFENASFELGNLE